MRKLRLKIFFDSQPEKESRLPESDLLVIRPKSTFDPQVQNSILNLFEKSVLQDLSRIDYRRKTPINIKNRQLDLIDKLAKSEDITIKPADKGGAIVIMDTSFYVKRCIELLSDTDTYAILDRDPLPEIRELINNTLLKAKENEWINDKTHQYLTNSHPITPVFYGLPKIHKDKQNPPLRPIVAGTESIFDPLAVYIDRLLQPLIQASSTYLKDTTDFLNGLKDFSAISEDCILFSLDVCSLYTSIPHSEGIDSVEWLLLNNSGVKGNPQFILELLNLILYNSYFRHQGKYFLQTSGTSMGSSMAPVYANTFMFQFESQHVLEHPTWAAYILTWKRFIDDIFCIWCGTRDDLDQFFEYLNLVHPRIKFTIEIGNPYLHFLDVNLSIVNNKIATSIYHKPTDVNNLLHYSSFHPRAMLQSLPYSQILRLKRIISDPEVLDKECTNLVSKFQNRGYPPEILEIAKDRASEIPRTDLLKPKSEVKDTPLLYISKFSRQSFQITKSIKKHWNILHNDQTLLELFPTPPMMCFKRGKNIRDKLVKAERVPKEKQLFLATKKLGTFPCLGCIHCNNTIKGNVVTHPRNGQKIKLRDYSTCLTSGVIYMLKCPCGKVYVGQTKRPVKSRLSEHKSNIRCNNQYSPVARHFNMQKHTIAQLKYQVLEVVKRPTRGGDYQSLLLQREAYWIDKLSSLQPWGLNEDFTLNCFL
ncbi:uncharacterized protein [Ambystoma mexicanum]|uniref:uncharacterized protein n=1 Tax=Ambystoma mexicanum TaxID=8296 RepID=UPI0037E97851